MDQAPAAGQKHTLKRLKLLIIEKKKDV